MRPLFRLELAEEHQGARQMLTALKRPALATRSDVWVGVGLSPAPAGARWVDFRGSSDTCRAVDADAPLSAKCQPAAFYEEVCPFVAADRQ